MFSSSSSSCSFDDFSEDWNQWDSAEETNAYFNDLSEDLEWEAFLKVAAPELNSVIEVAEERFSAREEGSLPGWNRNQSSFVF